MCACGLGSPPRRAHRQVICAGTGGLVTWRWIARVRSFLCLVDQRSCITELGIEGQERDGGTYSRMGPRMGFLRLITGRDGDAGILGDCFSYKTTSLVSALPPSFLVSSVACFSSAERSLSAFISFNLTTARYSINRFLTFSNPK